MAIELHKPSQLSELRRSAGLVTPEEDDTAHDAAMSVIDQVTDPDEALRLVSASVIAEECARLSRLGEDREHRWNEVKIRAKRKWGQLLGPARVGAPPGNSNATGNKGGKSQVVPQARSDHRKEARKLAAVPDDKVESYFDRQRQAGKAPTEVGLAREVEPDLAGLKRARRKATSDPKPKPSGATRDIPEDELVDICTREIKRGKTQGQIAAQVGMRTDNMPFARAYGIAMDRIGRPAGRPRFNGKSKTARAGEVRRLKDQFPSVWKYLTEISRATTFVEALKVEHFEPAGLGPWEVGFLYDDLVSLAEATDRLLSAVSGWLDDGDLRAKIAVLRDTSGRTPEEAATALRIAERLERKLGARIDA